MDKKLLLILASSVGIMWFFNYYNKSDQNVGSRGSVSADIRSGQSYRVPSTQDLNRPINTEIDFVDKKITKKEHIEDFSTERLNVSFSNYGATLSTLDFKKH